MPPMQRRRRMDLETKHPRLIAGAALLRNERGVYLKEDVLEGRAEVSAVDGGVARGLGVVQVFALGAEEFDGLYGRQVGEACRKEMG